jgi:TetR/AcrR family transcriptional repressor of nem operon
LAALAPELARADAGMKGKIGEEMAKYKARMVPFMPGRRTTEKEHNFVVIFSTMIGAIAIARILPDRAGRARILASTRDFLLDSF